MKKISLAIVLSGLFTLLFLLVYSPPVQITPKTNLSILKNNQKVFLEGKITSQTTSSIIMDNKIKIYTNGMKESFVRKNVSIFAVVREYNSRKKLSLLKIQAR